MEKIGKTKGVSQAGILELERRMGGAQSMHRVNDARLGMVMKECFRVWNAMGKDPCGEKRERFIEEVLDTYLLFSAISERLHSMAGVSDIGSDWAGVRSRVPEAGIGV